ncbi:hypothetical protein ABBQ32_007434 [Trebouxia sp. C0010 RCD-2024]
MVQMLKGCPSSQSACMHITPSKRAANHRVIFGKSETLRTPLPAVFTGTQVQSQVLHRTHRTTSKRFTYQARVLTSFCICCTANSQLEYADTVKVAVLGIGLMGNKIARRLAEEGCQVAAWNRNTSKTEALSAAGISIHQSAQAAAQQSDVLVLMLSDADAIKDVLLSADQPVDLQGKVVVQMGTIGPKESCDIASQIEAAGAQYLEAPVLGSQPEASKGTLLIMVGSKTKPQESKAWSVLTKLGKEPMHMGAVGTAAATKLALNQLIASLTVGFSTSLGLLQRNGADIDKFMDILRGSALYAPTFDKKLQRMLDRDYANPNFPTKHLLKDIRLFTSEAQKVKLDTSLLQGLEAVIASTINRGLADTDYSAIHDGITEPQK